MDAQCTLCATFLSSSHVPGSISGGVSRSSIARSYRSPHPPLISPERRNPKDYSPKVSFFFYFRGAFIAAGSTGHPILPHLLAWVALPPPTLNFHVRGLLHLPQFSLIPGIFFIISGGLANAVGSSGHGLCCVEECGLGYAGS